MNGSHPCCKALTSPTLHSLTQPETLLKKGIFKMTGGGDLSPVAWLLSEVLQWPFQAMSPLGVGSPAPFARFS